MDTPAAGSPAEARALIEGGRFAEALTILGPLMRGAAVEPNLYFLFGIAAVGASQQPGVAEEDREALLNGAIAAFHEMLIDRPGLVRVHLELGRAFFLKGEDDLARRHFEWVLAGNPPQPVVVNVGSFLAAIQAAPALEFQCGRVASRRTATSARAPRSGPSTSLSSARPCPSSGMRMS